MQGKLRTPELFHHCAGIYSISQFITNKQKHKRQKLNLLIVNYNHLKFILSFIGEATREKPYCFFPGVFLSYGLIADVCYCSCLHVSGVSVHVHVVFQSLQCPYLLLILAFYNFALRAYKQTSTCGIDSLFNEGRYKASLTICVMKVL